MRLSHCFAKAPANLCSRVAFLEELNCIDIQKLAKSNRLLAEGLPVKYAHEAE